MPTNGVVEALHVVEDIGPILVARRVPPPMTALPLQRREEALRDGVVPDVARPTHAARDADTRQLALEVLRDVLTALSGMMEQVVLRVVLTAQPDRAQQATMRQRRLVDFVVDSTLPESLEGTETKVAQWHEASWDSRARTTHIVCWLCDTRINCQHSSCRCGDPFAGTQLGLRVT